MPHFLSRPTMRTIAKAAGVSPTAVSIALSGSPGVSEKTRAEIQAVARSMGFRPDPILTHLMEHLRAHRTSKTGVNLAVLSTLDAPFVHRLTEGAKARAAKLGYELDRINLKTYANKPGALTRMLVARGVKGLLLTPSSEPTNYGRLLDWEKFAAVAMTYSIYEPHVHRVVTHHFDNAMRTFALLHERGFKRIGLAMTQDMEFRANHSYSGAYFRVRPMHGQVTLPALMLNDAGTSAVKPWFAKHKPDAVVLANANHLSDVILPQLPRSWAQQTAFVCLDYEEPYRVSGIDQLFEIVGSHAVDVLVAQLHRNECGLPKHPTISMVEGEWRENFGLFPARNIGS